jgi:hypothetical protein
MDRLARIQAIANNPDGLIAQNIQNPKLRYFVALIMFNEECSYDEAIKLARTVRQTMEHEAN